MSEIASRTVRLDAAEREAQFLADLDGHRRILYKVARAYGRNEADREDLVQETVAQLWRAFPRFDPTYRFSTWMYRIALNVAISWQRRERSRTRHLEPDGAELLEGLAAASTSDVDHDGIRHVAVLRALDLAGPVNAVQQTLERVQVERLHLTRTLLLAMPVAWILIAIVAARALVGVDLWAVTAPGWIWANLAFGAVFPPVALALWRRFGARLTARPGVRTFIDDLAGESLRRARTRLAAVERFTASEP